MAAARAAMSCCSRLNRYITSLLSGRDRQLDVQAHRTAERADERQSLECVAEGLPDAPFVLRRRDIDLHVDSGQARPSCLADDLEVHERVLELARHQRLDLVERDAAPLRE